MKPDVMAELERLRIELEECRDCPLATSSPRVVFGEGNPNSPLIIVGEGPGEQEEVVGRPFVGRAGQLLDKLLAAASISRDEIWITNVLKRRASKLVDGKVKNRLPKAGELAYYRGYLDRELKLLSPRVILCLGNLAANALIHTNFRVTLEHGQWFHGPEGRKLMATYHPAYILRLEGNDYQEVLAQALEDFAAAGAEYRAISPRPSTISGQQSPVSSPHTAANGKQLVSESHRPAPRTAASHG